MLQGNARLYRVQVNIEAGKVVKNALMPKPRLFGRHGRSGHMVTSLSPSGMLNFLQPLRGCEMRQAGYIHQAAKHGVNRTLCGFMVGQKRKPPIFHWLQEAMRRLTFKNEANNVLLECCFYLLAQGVQAAEKIFKCGLMLRI